MAQSPEVGDRRQFLSFTLAGSEYGAGILSVREILQYEAATRVPSTPRSIRGVINLRGQVVPVVDLATKFGVGETKPSRLTCILIVEASLDGQPTVVGVLADAVREVIDLGPEEIEPPPSFGTHVKVDFLLGVGKVGKRFVLLLDLDRVLSADEKEFANLVKDGLPAAAPEGPAVPETRPAS
jgi:purine-binding chemotaxis protein CheW